MSEFKKGDLVVLKSGGPKMVVDDVGDYSGLSLGPKNGVSCIWFVEIKGVQQTQEKVFDEAVLEKYVPRSGTARLVRG